MREPDDTATRFAAIDAHDDTVEGFAVLPPAKRGAKPNVTVTLFRHWEGTRRLISFTSCANVEFIVDGDVLGGNWPNNTCDLQASTELSEIEAVMRRHKKAWHVSYDKSIDPLPAKIAEASRCVLFRVRLFGGVLAVVAKTFTIKRLRFAPPDARRQAVARG